ncbi:hypothetical protein FACS1894216_07440 [Synergistales bacterium]|nr:hypothetical protein FACS1894216_07440 [Synergistales bacterium]
MPDNTAFDVKDALGRLMNNKKLYEKLLTKFEANYGDFYGKLQAAVDSGNFKDAQDLAHTMKGLGGNLGAKELHAASLAVETIFKTGGAAPDLPEKMAALDAELNRALAEVRAGVNMDV